MILLYRVADERKRHFNGIVIGIRKVGVYYLDSIDANIIRHDESVYNARVRFAAFPLDVRAAARTDARIFVRDYGKMLGNIRGIVRAHPFWHALICLELIEIAYKILIEIAARYNVVAL